MFQEILFWYFGIILHLWHNLGRIDIFLVFYIKIIIWLSFTLGQKMLNKYLICSPTFCSFSDMAGQLTVLASEIWVKVTCDTLGLRQWQTHVWFSLFPLLWWSWKHEVLQDQSKPIAEPHRRAAASNTCPDTRLNSSEKNRLVLH